MLDLEAMSKIAKITGIFLIITLIIMLIIERKCSHGGYYGTESAAAATLINGIYAAEIDQSKLSASDKNKNGKGEFVLLSELQDISDENSNKKYCRHIIINEIGIGLLNKYCFTIYIPDGAGGAVSDFLSSRKDRVFEQGLKEQEDRFIAYAWPVDHKWGRRIFCIDETGVLRGEKWDGKIPVWNLALENGWNSKSIWHPLSK